MKNAKRWLAVILAVTLLGSNAIYQLGTTLSANETEAVTESQQDESENAVAVQEGTQQEDTGKATVQEVTPQEDKSDASAQESKPVQEEQQTKETQTESQTPAAVEAPQAEQTQEAAPANAGQSEPEAQAKTPVVQTYDVKINKPDLDGGQIKVWGTDGIQTDVTSYDGNNQYVKEVTEGEDFNFQITRNDGFEIENVTVNGAQIAPESTDGNVSTYKLSGVAEEKAITITYNKVETPAENVPEQETSGNHSSDSNNTENKETTVIPNGTTSENNQNESILDTDENVVESEPVEATGENNSILDKIKDWVTGELTGENVKTVSEENTVTVGQTIKLDGTSNSSWYRNYSQEWKSKDTNIATVSNDGTVTGVSAGKVTISHKYCTASHIYNRKHDTKTEKYEVTVVAAPKPTGISISGDSSVERFESINLKATLEPAGANADIIWTSSNEEIAEVDDGTVKGVTAGEVTITATTDVDGKKISATKKVTVTEAKKTDTARLFYLKTPTSDPKSNDTKQWGSQAGTCEISVKGLAWDSEGKNSFDNVASRVLKWPDGSTGSSWEITKSYDGGTHWNAIFNEFKAVTSAEVGRNITEDDVEAIIIHPYKISNNNDGMHVDCTVEVKVKGIITATYYLYDAGNDATGFTWMEAKQYRLENGEIAVAAPTTNCPDTKTVDGKDYVFDGWYAGSYGSGEKINYPDTVSENVNYYAKYVRANLGYTVKYYLNGTETPIAADKSGTAKRDGATVTERPAEIAGYTAVSTDSKSIRVQENGTNEIIFYYYKNVELTANNASQKYNGREYQVSGYSGAPKDANFSNITVSAKGTDAGEYDAKFAKNVVGTIDATGKYIVTNTTDGKLTITPRNVTLTSEGGQKEYDGTALTKDGVTVGGDGFVGDDGATYDVTGSITNVGETANTFTYELKEGTKKSNYEITTVPGKLKITPCTKKITVTITENNGSEKYDGTEKTVTGYKVTDISSKLYTKDDFSFTGDDTHKTVSGTNAGSYDMKLVSGDFRNNNENFDNVEFKIVDGKLDIEQRKVTLTSGTASKTYDGEPLTKDGVKVSGDGFVKGEEPTYNVTGTITDAGTVDNTFTYTFAEGVVKENYDITKEEGTLTVAPIDKVVVTITGKKDRTTYNGKEQNVKDYEVSISNAKYKEKDFEFSGKAIAKGTDAGTYKMGLKASDFKNTNKNFKNVEFEVTDGELTIDPKEVTLTSGSSERVYNGTALTNKNVAESDNGFVGNDGATYEVTGSQTNVGESENTFTYTLKDGTNADNYKIKTEYGKLKVTPVTDEVTVTITENSDTAKYDGTEKNVTGYKVTSISNPAYTENDFAFTGDKAHKTVSGINAGTYDMNLKASDFRNKNEQFSNVTFVIVDGKLNISKRSVTLTSASASRPYDGKALTNNTVTVGGEGFANGEGAKYDVTGTITNVGKVDNTFTYKLNEGTNKDNYEITKKTGELEITPVTTEVTVTITGNIKTDTYDGTEKTAEGYKVSIDNELYTEQDFSFDGEAIAKRTNAGTTMMGLKEDNFANTSENFKNVKFVVIDGKVAIDKRNVTLTSATDSKQYDGKPLAKKEVTVGGDGFAGMEGATYDVTGSQIKVGSSNNTFTYVLNRNTNADNYNITTHEGTLTVTNRDAKYNVTLVANSNTGNIYDGSEKSATGIQTDEFEIDGVKYKVSGYQTSDPTATDAGTYDNVITGTYKVMDPEGNDVTEQFAVATQNGKLEIAKRKVTLTSATDSKQYDGTPLTKKEVTVTGDGFATGEGATYNVTGSQTIVGSSDNEFTYTLNANTKAKNYNITKKTGTLTVTNRDAKYKITVEANSATAPYDGQPHSATGLKMDTFVVNGETYTVSGLAAEVTATDADEYANTVTGTPVVKDAAGNDVTAQFEVHTKNGKLTITKRTVIFTSATDSKPYDGKPLTNHEVTVTGDGFAEGEGASFNVTGSRTLAGKSDNTYEYTLNSNTNAKNYNITKNTGTLTITDRETKYDITVRANSKDTTYDGTEQTVVGFEQTTFVVDSNTYKVSGINAVAKGTDQGKYQTTITGTPVVTDEAENDVTAQFKVEVIAGQLNIAKRDLTITAGSAEAVYNGQALTKNTSEITGGTLATGDSYTATIEGSRLYVGSSENVIKTVTITADKAGQKRDVTGNYNITLVPGTLTVTDGTSETPVDPSLVVNKTHDANQTYKAGDVITFTITVKNIYDEVKTITLAEQEGVTLDKTVFENVQPGAEITATATYTVTEADIVNGTFTNNVTARFSGVDKKYTGTDTVEEFETPNPHMTITKTTKDVEKNHIYKLGETISYVITVKNDGNLTLTDVTVEDALTGNAGENAWTIPTFAPGEEQTFETSYVVTEADVLAGKVINNVTGTAKDPTNPDEPKTPVTPGEKEDPVEAPNPGLTVVKTSDKTGQVKLGDEITYTITVTNNGNVTISGVKLNDSLTGDNWTLGDIKPGEIVTRTTTYTVTEADILAGKIENHAIAAGKDPNGNDITDEGEKTVTTEESKPHITVTKETTSTPKNGETYALGEEITYKITAKNDGNLTLTNVTVEDELTGNTGDKAFKIDGEFKPGDEKSFETSYTVKESDLGTDGKGSVLNVATATGTTPDEKKPKPGVDPGKTEDPTDQKKPSMSIEKKVIDQKEKYEIGDTVKYEITVTNTGNTTQNNILVEDQMSAAGQAVITKVDGANGTIDGAKVTLDTLAPGKAATITAEYTVVKADRGNKIINVAVAKGEGEIPKTPEVPVQVEEVYDIHVVHAFAPGNEGNVALPDDYTIENLKPKTVKSLMAKGVTGYVAYPAVQNATVVDRDITVTFLYYKDEIGTDPTNPDKPDGVPDEFQAVVRFAAVNGSVSIDHAVVTLFGEDGKPAKNGVGHLSALQIAAATANAGYNQASLSWAPQAPTMDYNITGDMTFTATFTATPVTPPATPDNPRPNNPTRPSGQTTEPTGNAFVDNVVTPVVETVKEKAAKIQEVFNSDDEDVPLADQNLDNHKCCILHFLIMLITLLVYALATKSMKKRQKKLHEVREELDCELARRGLPLSREKE